MDSRCDTGKLAWFPDASKFLCDVMGCKFSKVKRFLPILQSLSASLSIHLLLMSKPSELLVIPNSLGQRYYETAIRQGIQREVIFPSLDQNNPTPIKIPGRDVIQALDAEHLVEKSGIYRFAIQPLQDYYAELPSKYQV
jgi:hypothetical protein